MCYDYYQINPSEVWAVIQDDLPPLRNQVASYLAETNWDKWEQNEQAKAESAVHKSLMQTAHRMKKDGMTTQQISRYTGLTAEEIEGL